MGDGIPTDQLSHNHCNYADSHCNSHIVLPYVPSLITSPSAAEVAQRLRLDEEVLDAPEELRQPVVGVGGDSQLFLDSTGGAAWPFSVGRVICLVSSVCKD